MENIASFRGRYLSGGTFLGPLVSSGFTSAQKALSTQPSTCLYGEVKCTFVGAPPRRPHLRRAKDISSKLSILIQRHPRPFRRLLLLARITLLFPPTHSFRGKAVFEDHRCRNSASLMNSGVMK